MLPPGQMQVHCGPRPGTGDGRQWQLVLLGRVLGSQEGEGEGDGVGVGVGVDVGVGVGVGSPMSQLTPVVSSNWQYTVPLL